MLALTRDVSASIGQCELTYLSRTPIDPSRARLQHLEYESALEALGCTVRRLPTDDSMPDSVFIEDMAVVFGEVALVARPGAASRRVEVPAVREALARYRPLVDIVPPGTLDGGDVLVVGRSIFVGRTARTSDAGIAQLGRAMAPFGYTTTAVAVHGCLHLKSAVTSLSDESLLIDPRWAAPDQFPGLDLVYIDPEEESAANVLRFGKGLLYPAAFPRTRQRLERRGFDVVVVNADELAKAEGAVTCCSLIIGQA